jgi:hypothetical protein
MGSLSGLPPIVFGVLMGMDKAGELILGTWLYGGGEDHDIVDDPFWTDYMMAHKDMRRQIRDRLRPVLFKILEGKKLGKFPIRERFHAEFPENSDSSGYALLHGSNGTVGDFLITGTAHIQEANDPAEGDYDIELDLRFRFNDIVDPNGNYIMDKIRSTIAKVVTIGRAKNYRLSITWGARGLVEFRKAHGLSFWGYPSDHRRPITPLPRATLDVADSHRKNAKDIEAKIIAQLQRKISSSDIPSLADRKKRLLWLCYGLSGFMRPVYLERLTADRASDELVRLLHTRITSELRAELIEAVRGKRPQGVAPL